MLMVNDHDSAAHDAIRCWCVWRIYVRSCVRGEWRARSICARVRYAECVRVCGNLAYSQLGRAAQVNDDFTALHTALLVCLAATRAASASKSPPVAGVRVRVCIKSGNCMGHVVGPASRRCRPAASSKPVQKWIDQSVGARYSERSKSKNDIGVVKSTKMRPPRPLNSVKYLHEFPTTLVYGTETVEVTTATFTHHWLTIHLKLSSVEQTRNLTEAEQNRKSL